MGSPSSEALLTPERRVELRRGILDWYEQNRRDLPWRGETDPYRILISEVMLQQTGVERVRQYYGRFVKEFPDFQTLAAASRLDVLRVWGGLGYNRRAVYLHECAKAVVENHGGRLPSDANALTALPGIGPYTRAALRSFAFGEDVPTVDTNIRRVLGRVIYGVYASPADIERVAGVLVPPGRSSDWNQALMDFGSLQCTPSNPACLICPVRDNCAAAGESPVRSSRRVAERSEPFLGSRRYLRGRIVARIRELPSGATLPITSLTDLVTDPEGFARILDIARGLAAHGLARIVENDEGVWIGAPD